MPSSPQVELSLFGQTEGERGGSPAATNEQVPGAERVLHDLQVSVQAVVQQTLSTQKPLAQSLSQPQGAPGVFLVPASWLQEIGASTPPSCLGGLLDGDDE